MRIFGISASVLEALKKRQHNINNLANHIMLANVGRFGSADAAFAARAHREETDLDVTSESVLRQKEACREAVEKCRAGRGLTYSGGGINGIIQDYNKTPFTSLGSLLARTI